MERSTDYPEFWVEVSTAKHKESIEGTSAMATRLWMEARPGSFEFNGMALVEECNRLP